MNYEQQQIETLSKQVAELQLKASIAIELLKERINTMQVQLMEGTVVYSEADLEDYLKATAFLNQVTGSKYDTLHVRQYLETL